MFLLNQKSLNILNKVLGLQHIICLNYIHEQDLTDVKQLCMIKQLLSIFYSHLLTFCIKFKTVNPYR
jgi:hypothetical protein